MFICRVYFGLNRRPGQGLMFNCNLGGSSLITGGSNVNRFHARQITRGIRLESSSRQLKISEALAAAFRILATKFSSDTRKGV